MGKLICEAAQLGERVPSGWSLLARVRGREKQPEAAESIYDFDTKGDGV